MALVAALLLGTFYFSKGDKYSTPGDLIAVMGTLFVSVLFVGFVNFQMIIPTVYMERPVMWRERASALYAVLPWVESMQVLVNSTCMLVNTWQHATAQKRPPDTALKSPG